MKYEQSTEWFLEKPYWVIDILPKQVPEHGEGQVFRVEDFFREHPQIDDIYRKFTNILLKLNCYLDIAVSTDGEEWKKKPAPKDIGEMVLRCMSDKTMLYFLMKSEATMITISSDDTYMTVYHPTEDILALLTSLAASEGLFVWKPEQV